MDNETLSVSKKYTNDTVIGLGALKGAPCTIKSVVKKDGQNIITLGWTGTDGTQQETKVYVDDGTPIYVWKSGNTYKRLDLVIYQNYFYLCVVEKSSIEFVNTEWKKIGSSDGNYDIVQNPSFLPESFVSEDRKMYYSIDDGDFYLWNGYDWERQEKLSQFRTMPIAAKKLTGKVVQYIGTTTPKYKSCSFYKCELNEGNYEWINVSTQDVETVAKNVFDNNIDQAIEDRINPVGVDFIDELFDDV